MGRSVGQQELQATHGGWRGGCKRLASEQPLAVLLSGRRLFARCLVPPRCNCRSERVAELA